MNFQFFKNLFKSKKQIQQKSNFFENIAIDKLVDQINPFLNLEQSILQQVIKTQKQFKIMSNFIADCMIMVLKRYGSKYSIKGGYNYLHFLPAYEVIGYVNDCFKRTISFEKYKIINKLNVLAKNQLFYLLLRSLNHWIIYNELENRQD